MKPQKCASSAGQMWMLRLDECLRHIFIFDEKISRKFVVVERDVLNSKRFRMEMSSNKESDDES